ncbi:hypothetical protein [Serratia ureilytica]|uniref:hypothetical protein n=1 Tax=Serratia ureilytica TaxID=300181 RepID=UPI00214EF1E6|nr:hypothetical protein [Serratia ureilytica]UUW17561.1 hypothetical protein NAL25_20535 [Serratia ureilytica]
MRKYAVITAALMMSSCATPEKWEAQTAAPPPLEAARAICRQEAEQRYPVSLSLDTRSPVFSSMTINGAEIPHTGCGAYPSDSNEMRRKEHVNACMKLEGWENKNKVTGLLAFLFN